MSIDVVVHSEFVKSQLLERDMAGDPFAQFQRWLDDVQSANVSCRSHVAKLDVVPETTIAVDAATELIASRACLHRSSAHLAVPDVANV